MTDNARDKAAIALKYNADPNQTPEILAAGKGPQAEAIVAAAQASGIHVRGGADSGLASIEMHTEIPPQFYRLVAEILWFVHRMDGAYAERKNKIQGGLP